MAHHMEACPKDNDVEWEVLTLLGDDTAFRERFHSVGRNCNVRRVQAFQVPGICNEMLGKTETVTKRAVPGTIRLQPSTRSYAKNPEGDHNSRSRTIVRRQNVMILFGSGRIEIIQAPLIGESVGSREGLYRHTPFLLSLGVGRTGSANR